MNDEDAKTIIKLLTDIRELPLRTLYVHTGGEWPEDSDQTGESGAAEG